MKIHPTAYIAPTATLIGDVTFGADSSAWYGAVIRADAAPIVIGDGTSVQDNAVLHADEDAPLVVGSRATIGHGAVVHGATIADDVLIGIGAIVLNHARVGEHCIIAAGAVVPEGTEIPPRSMVMGVPARVVRAMNDADIEKIHDGAQNYVARTRNYRKGIFK